MAALRSIAPLTLAAASVLVAVPAQAELKPSSPEAIAAAVADCWQATNASALDEAALKAKGWQAGSIQTGDGKPVPSAITFLGKKGSDVIMMVSSKVDSRGCTITSRVASVDAITPAAREIYKLIQPLEPTLKVKQPTPAEVAYFALPKVALLRPSGTKDKPGVTIQVSYSAAEKK